MYCELCDKTTTAKWKCLDCDQGMCDACRSLHRRISATRNHQITDITKIKSSSVDDNENVIHCRIHTKDLLQKYCITCSKSVCQRCIDEHHSSHQTVRVSNIFLNEKKKQLTDHVEFAEQKLVALSFSTESIKKKQKVSQNGMKNDIANIKNKEETLVAMVRSISEDYVKQIKIAYDDENDALKDKIQTVQKLMEELESNVKIWKEKLKMRPDASLIKYVSDAGEKLQKIEHETPSEEDMTTCSTKFIQSPICDASDLRQLFGNIETENDHLAYRTISNKRATKTKQRSDDRSNSSSETQDASFDSDIQEQPESAPAKPLTNNARPPSLKHTHAKTFDHVERESAHKLRGSYGGSFDYSDQEGDHLHTRHDSFDYMDNPGAPQSSHNTIPKYVESGAVGDGFVVSSFKPGKSASLVACSADQQSWIANSFYYGSKSVTLLTMRGETLREIDVGYQLYDMTLTAIGELLVTVSGGNDVKRLTGNRDFVTVANFSPFQTNGLCAIDKDVMVCLSNDDQGKVVRLTMSGKVSQTIEYDEQNRLIVKKPTLVRENADGNICIVDNGNLLVVTDNRGRVRFTYRGGIGAMRKEFRCLGMACDKLGNILLSDDWNHQVHLLDKRGKFVQFLPLKEHGITNPLGMCIDTKNYLWLCHGGGDSMSVINYLDFTSSSHL